MRPSPARRVSFQDVVEKQLHTAIHEMGDEFAFVLGQE
jgi:hypothetical protein